MQENIKTAPRFKWFVALLLVFAMLVSVVIPAQAKLVFVTEDTTPELRIVSTVTDGGKYLEVGLNVDSKDNTFQSAGVILTYDPAMLTPIMWTEQTNDDGSTVVSEIAVPTATDTTKAWTEATIIPAKGADELSGKLAKAVIVDGTGYLFLSAEAAKPIPLSQDLPTTSEEGESTEPTDPLPTPDVDAQDETGESTETTEPTAPTLTASGLDISYIAEAEATTPQATVVRFKVNEKAVDDTTTALYTVSELAASMDVLVYDSLTPDETAKNLLVYSTLAGIDPTADKFGGVSYIADNETFTTAGFDSESGLSFVWVENGVSVNTVIAGGGTPDPSNFAAVVFYDWDETLLGSVIVPKGDATLQVEAFTNARIADESELDEKYLWYSNEKIAEDEADPSKTPKYLSNKKSYDFDTWLLNDSETFTAQATALPKYDGTNDDAAAAAGVADFTNVTGDMIVKASYVENELINKMDDGSTSGLYSLSEPVYNRYGAALATTGIYSLQITIKRENADGYGVTRLREPGFRVNTTQDITGATAVNALNLMENKDITSVEIAVPKRVRTVAYAVIETYDVTNWPGAGQGSTADTKTKNAGTATEDQVGTDGFVKEGTLGFINTQCLIYLEEGSNLTGWDRQTNNVAFRDAGLTNPVGTTINATVASNYRDLIAAAMRANNNQPLTYQQMWDALHSQE